MSRLSGGVRVALLAAIVAAPAARGAEWPRASPASVGMDEELLEQGVVAVGRMNGVRCALVARGGYLVAERCWGGARADRPHDVKSASKSLLSALVGIALRDGLLRDLDQPVASFLGDELPAEPGGRREITVRHLLTMTTGLQSTSGEAYGAWVASRDWLRYALGRPLEAPPGERFAYSTGNTHLLGAVLSRAAGESLLGLARRRLLDPLGIRVASWQRAPEGLHFGGNSLAMTPRALARFGQLYADGGRVGGRQLVPADWVAESTRAHAAGWPERYGRYGYLWWVPAAEPAAAFAAVGYGGQFLWVAPELELVVAVTASHSGKGAAWDRRMLALFQDYMAGATRPSSSSRMKRSSSSTLASGVARNSSPRRTRPEPGE